MNHTHHAGLQPPSTSRDSLQLNQSSPALICPPEDRRCTPNQDRKSLRDNPRTRRSSFTFAAVIACNSIRRQTQAGLLSVCDNLDSPWPVMRVVPVAVGKSGSPCREQVKDSLFAADVTVHFTIRLHGHVETRRKRARLLLAYDNPVRIRAHFMWRCASCIPRVPKGNPGACRTATLSIPVLSLNVRANKTSRRSCVSPSARAAA